MVDPFHRTDPRPTGRVWNPNEGGGDSMTYERPVVLATYKVEELMKDAAVCFVYCPKGGLPGIED